MLPRLEGKEAPENCALLEELRLMTWPRSVIGSGELNGCLGNRAFCFLDNRV